MSGFVFAGFLYPSVILPFSRLFRKPFRRILQIPPQAAYRPCEQVRRESLSFRPERSKRGKGKEPARRAAGGSAA
jgi:hypothetical protein